MNPLVDRAVTVTDPQLSVADIPHRRAISGWVRAAFATDVNSRRMVGWQRLPQAA